MFELTQELIDELKSIDTPTVCNTLEVLVPERRGYRGYGAVNAPIRLAAQARAAASSL